MSVDIAVLTIIYGVCLGPIVGLLSWFVVRLARNPQAGQVFEGVATGAILAVFASLLLTHSGGVRGGVLVWLAFVIACGMAMWLPTPFRASDLFVASAVPSLVLLGATLALYAIPQFLHDFGCAVVSMSAEDRERACPPTPDVMGLTLFVALISIPGITVGLYARARLITFIKLAVGVGTVRNHHAQPHRHHALPIQAPAAEAEGGDRHHEKPPPPYLGRKSGGGGTACPLFRRGSTAKHTARGRTSHCSATRQRRPQAGNGDEAHARHDHLLAGTR